MPISTEDPDAAFDKVCELVSLLSDVKNGANPGVVFWRGDTGAYFRGLYDRAVRGMVNRHSVEKALRELRVETFTLGNGMGLVGASASLGFDEASDHTYELIAYRRPSRRGTRRMVDGPSVEEMDVKTFPETFNNYDYQKRKVLVAPSGPDPVFFGVRGSSPDVVISASRMLRHSEELEGWITYVSNQYTDAHLVRETDLRVYSSGWTEGRVSSLRIGRGGHVYFNVGRVECAVYRPTGELQRTAKLLSEGDQVRAYGGVRRPSSKHASLLNVEKIEVISVAALLEESNPECPHCHHAAKSEGFRKGFQCRGCGMKFPVESVRSKPLSRLLVPGVYAVSPRSNRHLAKPLVRYGREVPGLVAPEVEAWVGRFTYVEERARPKSWMRSSASSTPTATLISDSGIPDLLFSSSET